MNLCKSRFRFHENFFSREGNDSMKNEIVYISGPYESYSEACDTWEVHYGGYDGPYWVEEVREGVWYIVSDAEYENTED